MIEVLSLTLLGLFLGMRHATDPDHVIAVSTIVSRQPSIRCALVIGSLWGVGHTLTIVAVGGAIVLFTIVIPPRLGLTMEMAVALMLVVLGMWNLTGVVEQLRAVCLPLTDGADGREPRRDGVYGHRHAPGLVHRHDAPVPRLESKLDGLALAQFLRPLIVGLVHGLAGSAAVALLVLALIKNPWWAMAYLVLFGFGTIIGMMVITGAIGAVLTYASRRSPRIERHLRLASGLLSLCFGLFLAYQIGIVDGLIAGQTSGLPE
jgi:ABC-type nickel/cobalt efflux system permease component RcnA